MPRPRRPVQRRRGQSAVETLIALPIVILVIVAMVQLWSLTWATQNAHLRAREAVLHGSGTYLRGSRSDGVTAFAPFSGRNYTPALSRDFYFRATATDQTLPGVNDRGTTVRATAVLRSR